MAAWVINSRAAVVIATLTIAATGCLVVAESSGVLSHSLPSLAEMHAGDQIVVYLLCVVLAVLLVRAYRTQLSELHRVSAALTRSTFDLEVTKTELNQAQSVAKVGSWVYGVAEDSLHLSPEACRIFLGCRRAQQAVLPRS
jgi:hypothetical protein